MVSWTVTETLLWLRRVEELHEMEKKADFVTFKVSLAVEPDSLSLTHTLYAHTQV